MRPDRPVVVPELDPRNRLRTQQGSPHHAQHDAWPRREIAQHGQQRQRPDDHQVGVGTPLEQIATDAKRVVGEVHDVDADDRRCTEVLASYRREPSPTAHASGQPSCGDEQPGIETELDHERRAIAQARLGPRLDRLCVVRAGQPRAVVEASKHDVTDYRQHRGRNGEQTATAIDANAPPDEQQCGRGDDQVPLGPADADESRQHGQPQPVRRSLRLRAPRPRRRQRPRDQPAVEDRLADARAQRGKEGPVADDRHQHERDQPRPNSTQSFGQRQLLGGARNQPQRAETEAEREGVRDRGRLDAEHLPDRQQQQRPQEVGVAVGAMERLRVPHQPVAQHRVAEVAVGDERIVGEMPGEQPAAPRRNAAEAQHQPGRRAQAQTSRGFGVLGGLHRGRAGYPPPTQTAKRGGTPPLRRQNRSGARLGGNKPRTGAGDEIRTHDPHVGNVMLYH